MKQRKLSHVHVWLLFAVVTVAPMAWVGCSDDKNKDPIPQISSADLIPLPSSSPSPSDTPAASPSPSPSPTDPVGRVMGM